MPARLVMLLLYHGYYVTDGPKTGDWAGYLEGKAEEGTKRDE